MTQRRKRAIWLTAMALIIVVGGLATTLHSTDDSGPEGILAFKRFLNEMGIDVHSSSQLPQSGTLLLVEDLRSNNEANVIVEWIREGGRLVLLQPESEIAHILDVNPTNHVSTFDESVEVRTDCLIAEATGVRNLVMAGQDRLMETPGPAAATCYHINQSFFLASLEKGEGKAIVLGGRSVFTNEFLRRGDNAALAHVLFSGFGPVTFGGPLPPEVRDQTAWQLLPTGAKVAIVEIALAALLLAVAQGRRWGKPVLEEPLAVIPASELVRATASLYRMAHDPGFAGRILRQSFLRRVGRRFGTGSHEGERLARIISSDPAVDAKLAEATLSGEEPHNDEELIRLAKDIADLESKLLRTKI